MQQENVIQVLNDPLAQELLNSAIPARLAYTGSDGFPRVVPVGFYWNGAQFVIGTAPIAPKVQALATNPKAQYFSLKATSECKQQEKRPVRAALAPNTFHLGTKQARNDAHHHGSITQKQQDPHVWRHHPA